MEIPKNPDSRREIATFNASGALASLISNGKEIPVHGRLQLKLSGTNAVSLQPSDPQGACVRKECGIEWIGTYTLPTGGKIEIKTILAILGGKLRLLSTLTPITAFPGFTPNRYPWFETEHIEYVLDIPRKLFEHGVVIPTNRSLALIKHSGPLHSESISLSCTNALFTIDLCVKSLDSIQLYLSDIWTTAGRYFRISARLHTGRWLIKTPLSSRLSIAFSHSYPTPAKSSITIDLAQNIGCFDGFGGNFRMHEESAVAPILLEDLKASWIRIEFKALDWSRFKEGYPFSPGLKQDIAILKQAKLRNIPWVLSLWALPENYLTDSNQTSLRTFGRTIAPDRWPDFLNLLSDFILHLKRDVDTEPDLFSFNEPDLGVNIGQTPEEHQKAIIQIGSHFQHIGLKTKLLLGDCSHPRESYRFALAAASDPQALSFIGAISFHSWGQANSSDYAAWKALSSWLRLPLIIGEAGVDPAAYQNRTYDSYAYGLREMRLYHNLLKHSTPSSILYWQYTEDYGLANLSLTGQLIPTGRYSLLKHFTNLTPPNAHVHRSSSDHDDILVSAFSNINTIIIHVLNHGPEISLEMKGVPSGHWTIETTTEFTWNTLESRPTADLSKSFMLPARSMTTFIHSRIDDPL